MQGVKLRANGRNNSQHCCELLCPCWQWCANRCYNSQQGWDLQCIMGGIQTIRLWTPRVIRACVAPSMLEELCNWIQHCCATLRGSRNSRNVGKGQRKVVYGRLDTKSFRCKFVHAQTILKVIKISPLEFVTKRLKSKRPVFRKKYAVLD